MTLTVCLFIIVQCTPFFLVQDLEMNVLVPFVQKKVYHFFYIIASAGIHIMYARLVLLLVGVDMPAQRSWSNGFVHLVPGPAKQAYPPWNFVFFFTIIILTHASWLCSCPNRNFGQLNCLRILRFNQWTKPRGSSYVLYYSNTFYYDLFEVMRTTLKFHMNKLESIAHQDVQYRRGKLSTRYKK